MTSDDWPSLKGAWPGCTSLTWSISEFYTPLNFSGMAKDRIVEFCARVGPRCACLVMTNFPQTGVVKVTWRPIFGQISINISKTVHDTYILTYNWRLIGNSIWLTKWQQRQWPWMTFWLSQKNQKSCHERHFPWLKIGYTEKWECVGVPIGKTHSAPQTF